MLTPMEVSLEIKTRREVLGPVGDPDTSCPLSLISVSDPPPPPPPRLFTNRRVVGLVVGTAPIEFLHYNHSYQGSTLTL